MSQSVDERVKAFFAKYPARTYPKGQILIHAGEQPEKIYYIVSGRVKQYDISYRGDEIVVNVFKEKAFFPMLWALIDTPNKFFFGADDKIEARLAPPEDVINFLKDEPDITFDLLKRVYIGLDGVLGRMVHLMSGSAKSRLLYELITEAKRFGKQSDAGYVLSVNETEISSRAGLSRETVSREMRKLSNNNLVSVTRSQITVKDLEALAIKLSKTA